MIRDLKERGIDFAKTYWDLIQDQNTPIEQRVKLLIAVIEFIYPKRRPEDSSGDPGETLVGTMIVTDDQLKDFIKIARAPK